MGTGLNRAVLSAVLRLPLGSALKAGYSVVPGAQPFYTRHAWRANALIQLALPAVLPRVFSQQVSRQIAQLLPMSLIFSGAHHAAAKVES